MEEENAVLKQLHERRSVRAFEERAVSQDVKDAVIGAAFEAPTAGDMMFYTIIDVTDQAALEALAGEIAAVYAPHVRTAGGEQFQGLENGMA